MCYEIELFFNSLLTGYNDKSYWKMRFALYRDNLPELVRYWYLYRCRRMEAKNCASLGIRKSGGGSIPIEAMSSTWSKGNIYCF